jgi:predicted RNase H-like nuclease (RuvC/YqgF family)
VREHFPLNHPAQGIITCHKTLVPPLFSGRGPVKKEKEKEKEMSAEERIAELEQELTETKRQRDFYRNKTDMLKSTELAVSF